MDLSVSTAIDDLTSRLDDVQAAYDRLERDNAALRATLTGTEPGRANGTLSESGTSEDHRVQEIATAEDVDRGVSRRVMLRKAATAAAVTVAGVAVLNERGARPAAATNGNPVSAGAVTTAETRTSVIYDGASGYHGVVLLGNDSTYDGAGANFPAGIGGWAGAGATAGSGGVANGVYGFTDNGAGNGVVGYNSNAVNGGGAGVLGIAFGASAAAVRATNTQGTAVDATSASTAAGADAIRGVISSTSPGDLSAAVRAGTTARAGSASA